jgi:hypothetical protein
MAKHILLRRNMRQQTGFPRMKSQIKRAFPFLASLLALTLAACATQPPPDIPPPPKRKLAAKTQLATGRTY